MLLLDVLTRQVSWPGDLDLYFASSAFYTFYVNVQYLLNYKAYNHQTLQSASPQCTNSAGTLTGWPWPIFRAPLTFTPFTSPFFMSSTVRPSTTKPYIALLLHVLTRQCRPRWLSWMRRPTGDQEVAGSTPAEVGNILSWRLIMKYFLRSFPPFRWFKKGSCQFLAKECAQYWLTA